MNTETGSKDLEKLAREYPPRDRRLGLLVLRQHTHIVAARQHGWHWTDIAAGLGLDRAQAKGLALSFRRIQARIDAGTLVAPAATKLRLDAQATASGFKVRSPQTFKFDDDK